jgi:hypothetical protein
MMMKMMAISMGWDYSSELRPPTGLLFTPPGDICAWRTMVEWYWQRKNLNSSTIALWQSCQHSHTVAKQKELEDWAKEMIHLALQNILVHTCKWFLTCRKILGHGTCGFTSDPKKGLLRILIASAGFEPVNLQFNGNHTNHYTTEATSIVHAKYRTDARAEEQKPRSYKRSIIATWQLVFRITWNLTRQSLQPYVPV